MRGYKNYQGKIINGNAPHNDTVFITDPKKIGYFYHMLVSISKNLGGIENTRKVMHLGADTYLNIRTGRRISTDVGYRILNRWKSLNFKKIDG